MARRRDAGFGNKLYGRSGRLRSFTLLVSGKVQANPTAKTSLSVIAEHCGKSRKLLVTSISPFSQQCFQNLFLFVFCGTSKQRAKRSQR